jgi:hypothetical protein
MSNFPGKLKNASGHDLGFIEKDGSLKGLFGGFTSNRVTTDNRLIDTLSGRTLGTVEGGTFFPSPKIVIPYVT